MKFFWRAYLIFSFAVMTALILCLSAVMLRVPFENFQITIFTNIHGEGVFEAILILLAIPGMAYFLVNAMDDIFN